MIKLKQMEYFVTTVLSGSLTSASKKLFISQPALTKQLQQLEEELGCQLFYRKTTGLEITEAGKYLFENASKILNDVENLTEHMNTFNQKNIIRIGALPSIGSHLLPALIPKLSPKYKLELTIKDTTSQLVSLIENGKIDLAFVQDASTYNEIIVKHLFNEPYDAILSHDSPLIDLETVSIEQLLREQLILQKVPCDIRAFLDRYCEEMGFSIHPIIELEFNDSIIAFVTKGIGSSFVPRMVAAHIKHSTPSAIIKSIEDEDFKRSIDLLYKYAYKKKANEVIQHLEPF
ncbi:LysR family transcriptional regulator [Neobacillus niacini]|uniref:LysR family transcriptional regulator n=1 Tax=Neobacillus niacini TaxID=86668 RepID=UPI0021CB2CD0|nr:LysR family transcriptional regulator [Neobacillus niacini]MCM3766332.1 LysR family transcriptional regulator [Neobacillus niacini]